MLRWWGSWCWRTSPELDCLILTPHWCDVMWCDRPCGRRWVDRFLYPPRTPHPPPFSVTVSPADHGCWLNTKCGSEQQPAVWESAADFEAHQTRTKRIRRPHQNICEYRPQKKRKVLHLTLLGEIPVCVCVCFMLTSYMGYISGFFFLIPNLGSKVSGCKDSLIITVVE